MRLAGQVRNSLVYMIPMVVGTALPVLTLPIFTRILTPGEYGVLAIATAYGAFLSSLANIGLPLTYERNFFQYTERGASARLLYSILLFVGMPLGIFGVGTWFFRENLSMTLTRQPGNGVVLFVSYCAFSLQSVKQYFLTYFKNAEDARAFVRYSIDETLLWTAFSLLFVGYLRMGPVGMPLGQLVGGGIILIVLAARFARKLKPAFDRQILDEAVRMSIPLTPRIVLGVVSNHFDKYIIGMLGTMGGVGLYSIGQKISLLAFSVMTALQNVFAPAVYRRMFAGGEAARGIGRYLTPFAYASAGVALLIALFAEEVLFLLTPREFHGAAVIVNVLAMYYAIQFFGKQPQLMYAKKAALLSALSGASVVIYVTVTFLFVHRWGALGAAWGTLAAGVITTFLGVSLGQRYYRIHYETRRMVAIFGLLGVVSATHFLLHVAGEPYGLRLAFKLTSVIAFIAMGWRLDYFGSGFLSRLRGMPVAHDDAHSVGDAANS